MGGAHARRIVGRWGGWGGDVRLAVGAEDDAVCEFARRCGGGDGLGLVCCGLFFAGRHLFECGCGSRGARC